MGHIIVWTIFLIYFLFVISLIAMPIAFAIAIRKVRYTGNTMVVGIIDTYCTVKLIEAMLFIICCFGEVVFWLDGIVDLAGSIGEILWFLIVVIMLPTTFVFFMINVVINIPIYNAILKLEGADIAKKILCVSMAVPIIDNIEIMIIRRMIFGKKGKNTTT